MNTLLQQDRARRPDLFQFYGPITGKEMDAWLGERNIVIPEDLKQLWCDTGGGEMFESETILSPKGRSDLADDVESVNEFHKQKGMTRSWLIFHTGIGGLTVVKVPLGEYASIREGSYEVQQTFQSLADWYGNFVRREYATRYGLNHD